MNIDQGDSSCIATAVDFSGLAAASAAASAEVGGVGADTAGADAAGAA
jgi:hypothetical protein